MPKIRIRGEAVRQFIIEHVEKHPSDIARVTADRFGITRQAVSKHLQKLVAEGALGQEGNTRSRSYSLSPLERWSRTYPITPELHEDEPWLRDVAPFFAQMPENVRQMWHYGFTEMFNNAIDHSEGTQIGIDLEKTAASTRILIRDDGVGIFKKIQAALDLLDERHSALELAKGKFTTDPKHHSGEGIFFTSRIFDEFDILSGGVFFEHEYGDAKDWIVERDDSLPGTLVMLKLNNHTARTTKKVFDKFTSGDDYGFNKTVVPVKLARYGDDNLVSRSQAKRLLSRIDRFKVVILDFRGVDSLGQAFADEIFRVFPGMHPEIEVLELNAGSAVKRMISRARSADQT